MAKDFKVLEIYGTDKGCRIELLSIPEDAGLIFVGDLKPLTLALEEKLQRFVVEVDKHNARLLEKASV